jgi:hypothetical protein
MSSRRGRLPDRGGKREWPKHWRRLNQGLAVVSANKSLLRAGGRWYLVCTSLAVIDKVRMTGLGEPPGAELSRYATESQSFNTGLKGR